MSRNMRAADAPPANMGRTEGTAAVPAKPAAMSAKACEVSAATVSPAARPAASTAAVPATPAAVSANPRDASPDTESDATTAAASAAAMPTASAAAGVCLDCEKRHDEEQDRGHASASRKH